MLRGVMEAPPAQRREPQGLAAEYDIHRAALLRFLRARTRDAAEAEDVLQELWIRLREVPGGPIGNARGYLFQMANNLVLDRERAGRRRHMRERSWSGQAHAAVDTTEGIDAVDPARTPEQILSDAQERELLLRAIQNLPEAARRAFCLHKLEELSHAEVAARLGISRSGVEKHIALAMKHLRQALSDCGTVASAPSSFKHGQEP
jgi:RNA polymerase sigma-70 factor (ECF subfamily)